MKKIYNLLIAIVLCFSSVFCIAGCKDSDSEFNFYIPDGAPALAMAKLIYEDNHFGYDDVDYEVVSSSNIGNCILQKKADVAILPVNMASKILNDGKEYKVIATVTNGNLYIVGNKDINSLNDLTGEVVGVIGQGNVPDLNFRALLSENDVVYQTSESVIADKVAIRYFAEASNLLPMLKTNKLNFGLLPEPAVSKLLSMASNFNVELDIQTLWEGGSYPQAVLVMRRSLCENTTLVNNILSELEENESWVLENSEKAVNAINSELEDGVVASLQTTISRDAITNCNIDIRKTTSDEIARIKAYLSKIKAVVSNAVGEYYDNMFWQIQQ